MTCKSDADFAKAVLRAKLRAARAARGDDTSADAIRSIRSAHLMRVFIERAPRCIAFYWPVAGEFDTRAVMRAWLQHAPDCTAALPVVTDCGAPLSFYRWTPETRMVEGRFRIPVPASAFQVHPDLLLIPCLGFDAARIRLGYGGGYYDRTLAAAHPRPFTVGMGYECSRIDRLPREPHDIPLDIVLTECARYT